MNKFERFIYNSAISSQQGDCIILSAIILFSLSFLCMFISFHKELGFLVIFLFLIIFGIIFQTIGKVIRLEDEKI